MLKCDNYLSWMVTGAISSLTAAAVVVTGLIGANFVQTVLDNLRFRDPIARGIATASRYEQFHYIIDPCPINCLFLAFPTMVIRIA